MTRLLAILLLSLSASAQWQKGDLVRVKDQYGTAYTAEIFSANGGTSTVKWTEWTAAAFQVEAVTDFGSARNLMAITGHDLRVGRAKSRDKP